MMLKLARSTIRRDKNLTTTYLAHELIEVVAVRITKLHLEIIDDLYQDIEAHVGAILTVKYKSKH